MGLVGRLEDLSLAEILQILALGNKSGKLTVTRPDAAGVIVLRHGKIIYAASNSVHETFGNILICRDLVSEAELAEALERQHRANEEKRLGAILVEMGALAPERLYEVMHQQISRVIAEFFQWRGGFFKFERMEIDDCGEVEVDAKDFLVEVGVSVERVVLDLSREFDELQRDEREAARSSDSSDRLVEAMQGEGGAPLPASGEETLATLKSIMAEMESATVTSEITLMIMRYASTMLDRGLLLLCRGGEVAGIGQFGLQGASHGIDECVRHIRIPLGEPSILAFTRETGETYLGRLPAGKWNDYLVEQLGGAPPGDVVVIPVRARGDIVAFFYGDNAYSRRRIEPIEGLELVILEAGLAIQKPLAAKPVAATASS